MTSKRVVRPADEVLRAIKDHLAYEPQTGRVRVVTPYGKNKTGDYVGKKVYQTNRKPKGVYIQFAGRRLKRSHIAYYLVHGFWPTRAINHINDDVFDDREFNLRHATLSEVARRRRRRYNHRIFRRTESGTSLTFRGRFVGTYPTYLTAIEAYNNLVLDEDGEFARVIPT